MTDDYVISEIEKEYIIALLEQNKRVDGREVLQYRSVEIETNYIEKAEGSAVVTLGDTKIIVGVKSVLGTPFPDSPNSGVITTGAELSPIASPFFESGPPSEKAIELARVTDRAIRESHCIDFTKLCVIPGKLVWILFLDFYILNHDGNLFDAAVLGSVAALATAKIPKIKVTGEEHEVLEEKVPLEIQHYPVSVTTYRIGKNLLIDPTFKEERVTSMRLTFAFDEDDHIVSAQKGDNGVLKPDEVMSIVKQALGISKVLRKELMKALPSK